LVPSGEGAPAPHKKSFGSAKDNKICGDGFEESALLAGFCSSLRANAPTGRQPRPTHAAKRQKVPGRASATLDPQQTVMLTCVNRTKPENATNPPKNCGGMT